MIARSSRFDIPGCPMSEWCPIVEEGAPVPVAVRLPARGSPGDDELPPPGGGELGLPRPVGDVGGIGSGWPRETIRARRSPRPPAPRLKPSFQSPVPIRGKASTSQPGQRPVESPSAVVEHRSFRRRSLGGEEGFVLARGQLHPTQIGHHLLQYLMIAGHLQIVGDGIGKPQVVIGDAGFAPPCRRTRATNGERPLLRTDTRRLATDALWPYPASASPAP